MLMDKAISIAQMMPVIDEMLKAGKNVEIKPHGVSMYPSVKDGDIVTLTAPKDNIRKYDIVLYTRSDGSVILHRVCAIRSNGFVMAGDSQNHIEYPVLPEQIVGVVIKVVRDSVTIYDRAKPNKVLLFLRDIRHMRAKLKLYAHMFYRKYIKKEAVNL